MKTVVEVINHVVALLGLFRSPLVTQYLHVLNSQSCITMLGLKRSKGHVLALVRRTAEV